MGALPTGTVTFLFTDVEGSTRLWEEAPETMRRALVEHDALIEQLAERYGGSVVRPRGEGDSRFCIFARATDAVAAAAAMQRTLHDEVWPMPIIPLRVRMALHTGEADLRDGDYYGSAVNRCARLRAIAHGGQTLLSEVTVGLVRGGLAEGLSLRDLGMHRLKDLAAPERVYQLCAIGLPDEHPALRSLDARPHNLPVLPTAVIGRERETAAARALLLRPGTRLLTLTGPGGIGKTRLGLQLAADGLDEHEHGVWFVALAPIADPELVLPTVAQVLGLAEVPGQSTLAALIGTLRERSALLVLDNFEQVVEAAPEIGELLAACPGVKALATSRVPLRIYGEQEYPVPPLPLPETDAADLLATLDSPAVRLFVERARAARPDWAPDRSEALAVAEICRHLDGLPLAIELAAARANVLPPRAMLARMGSRLALLTGGARDRPARQQTLRNAIAWSHDLLTPDEQALFRRLSIFVGGCRLDAAEAVSGSGSVLDELASLVEKNLLRQAADPDGEPRFWMLETIREFALEQLQASGEDEAVARAHAAHLADHAEAAEVRMLSGVGIWYAIVGRDHDNVRAAVRWSVEHDELEIGLRLVGALSIYFIAQSHLVEGRRWTGELLARAAGASPARRGKVLFAAGVLSWAVGDPESRGDARRSRSTGRSRTGATWRSRSTCLDWASATPATTPARGPRSARAWRSAAGSATSGGWRSACSTSARWCGTRGRRTRRAS